MIITSIISIAFLLLLEEASCSVKLFENGTNQYTLTSNQTTEDIMRNITSFAFESNTLQTLELFSNTQFALTTYDSTTGDITERAVFEKECDQALLFHINWLICRAQHEIFKIQVKNHQLYIAEVSQAEEGQIVATYQEEENNNEIYLKVKEKIVCTRFDSLNCQTSFELIRKIINKNNNQGPILIKQNDKSSIMILKCIKENEVDVSTDVINFEEPIKTHYQYPRMLGNAPTFSSLIPAILSIKLGSTYSLQFPTIVDETPASVSVSVKFSSIPYITKVTTQTYILSPPLSAYSSLSLWSAGASQTYKMTIVLKDVESKSTTYYYNIKYTNTAPYFQIAPTTSITATQQKNVQLPTIKDDEGHTVSLVTTLKSASPQSKITYDSAKNQFVVSPSSCDAWTTSFQFWLTDQDLISTKYTMIVAVSVAPPYFKTTPTFQPASNPYKLNVMNTLPMINLPDLYDPDGHSVSLVISYTPPLSSVTALTYVQTATTLKISSTQASNAGPMISGSFSGKAIHTLVLKVQDSCMAFTAYPIAVEVSNTAPKFIPAGFSVPKVELFLNQQKTIDLSANINDIESHQINIAIAQMDSYWIARAVPAMFSVVAPSSILINPTLFTEIALYKLRVEIYDWRPYSSFLYFDVNVLNKAPVFTNLTALSKLKVRFNTTFEYLLPDNYDPENNTIEVKLASIPDTINSFAYVYPYSNPEKIIFNPTAWTQVTQFKVNLTLTDTKNSTYYLWDIEVFNTPPYFEANQKPQNQKVRFNSTNEYQLPKFSDDEKNPVSVSYTFLPSFITFDKQTSKLTIFPKKPTTDIGKFNVNGNIHDYKLQTDFKFTVTVFNDPPYFKQSLPSTVTAFIGQNKTFILPASEDKEQMPFKITAKIKDVDGPLPPFIKFSEINKLFEFSPDLVKQVGYYDIDVFLDDGYSQKSKYRFRLNVEDPNKNKISVSPIKSGTNYNVDLFQANFKILEVTRDGKCNIKILATKGADILTKEINSETFKIVVLTKKNQPVTYKVDSRNIAQSTVQIQLTFNNSKKISSSTEKDRIELRVDKSPEFKNQQMLCFLPFDLNQQATVPPQVSKEAASVAAKFKGGIEVISTTAVPGGMVVNLSVTFVIQYIWGLLNDMSFLTINAMISISVPGTAKLIQMALLNFIYLDILQTDKWLIPLLFKDEDSNPTTEDNDKDEDDGEYVDPGGPLNDFFDENGFSSKYLIENLGSTFVYILLLVFLLLLILLMPIFESLCSSIKIVTLFLKKHMIWNVTLRFIIQQAPPISIACGINLYLLNFKRLDGKSVSSVLSLVFICSICIAKIFVFVLLRKYQKMKQLSSDYFIQRYGTLVEGLNLNTNIGVYWNLLILIRWSLTNTILILLRDHNYAEILFLLLLSYIYQIFIIIGQPYYEKLDNKISLFNEVMVSVYLYVLMMLTDYLGENEYRSEQGLVLVVIIMTNVALNILKLIINLSLALIKHCRRKRMIKEFEEEQRLEQLQKQELQQRQEDIERYIKYNPHLYNLDYIPTPEEEQMMAERRKFLMLNDQQFNLSSDLVVPQKTTHTTASAFNQILNNWRGVSQQHTTKFDLSRDPIIYNDATKQNNFDNESQLDYLPKDTENKTKKKGQTKNQKKDKKQKKADLMKKNQNQTYKNQQQIQWQTEDKSPSENQRIGGMIKDQMQIHSQNPFDRQQEQKKLDLQNCIFKQIEEEIKYKEKRENQLRDRNHEIINHYQQNMYERQV